MVHLSENSSRLNINEMQFDHEDELYRNLHEYGDICLLRLPIPDENEQRTHLQGIGTLIRNIADQLAEQATVIVFGDVADLVHVHAEMDKHLHYQLWIAIKRDPIVKTLTDSALVHQHIGALVYTKYDKPLQHTKTRLEYTYCPTCNKTTKDYGGKKHTYHNYGTLISDIWRDISVDPCGDISAVVERFADLFGLEPYKELRVIDLKSLLKERVYPAKAIVSPANSTPMLKSKLLNGDCLTQLRTLSDNSIDFVFADPPYNLKKDYHGYSDDLDIAEYFRWCDEWITEVARVLRPGGTFALLNIPLWSIRHFLHLEIVLDYQNWIVWDALSFPVRMIMPAHYSILCFSKGRPRSLPGLTGRAGLEDVHNDSSSFRPLAPLGESYCLRSNCVLTRSRLRTNDRGILSDIWWDIHRLKHNTRRVDHPCQLPPQLLYRLIALFTLPDEVVLDCFNGAGTTTLCAHQLGRRYIGIELDSQYYQMTIERHIEIENGIDPFRKQERVLVAKNSPVARLKKQKYEISKKTLQLEVRRIAQIIGHLPSREEMIEYGDYEIRYYDEYFSSWGEVCAAARTTGMTETREEVSKTPVKSSQPRLF
jgi:DNA modification methylase